MDVGCGVGRWAKPLVEAGHRVIGLDPSAGMVCEALSLDLGSAFAVSQDDADSVEIEAASVDLVLCDSLLGLVIELIRNGDAAQAAERSASSMARFSDGSSVVEHHLYTADRLERAFAHAGLIGVNVRALLIEWHSRPREEAQRQLVNNWDSALAVEAALSELRPLADHGKQLLASATAPPDHSNS